MELICAGDKAASLEKTVLAANHTEDVYEEGGAKGVGAQFDHGKERGEIV